MTTMKVSASPTDTAAASTPAEVDIADSLPSERNGHVVFTSIQKLFDETLEHLDGDFVICSGITPRIFSMIERERDVRRRKFRLFFRPEAGLVHITVPSGPHEDVTNALGLLIGSSAARQGRLGKGSGATAFTSENTQVPGIKEADYSFKPNRPPGPPGGAGNSAGQKWPTLVIETGYSETISQLRHDMHWWFGASNHQVKIVLLVDLDRQTQRIAVYKYTEDWPLPQASSTLTNPILRHTNVITPIANARPAAYQVDRTDLVLDFRLLLLRPPQPGTNEADIVITTQDLEMVAEDTWSG